MAGVAVREVGLAEPFQGACFFEGHADVAGDGECLTVVLASPAATNRSRSGSSGIRVSITSNTTAAGRLAMMHGTAW